jgi:hypothetical protein
MRLWTTLSGLRSWPALRPRAGANLRVHRQRSILSDNSVPFQPRIDPLTLQADGTTPAHSMLISNDATAEGFTTIEVAIAARFPGETAMAARLWGVLRTGINDLARAYGLQSLAL